MITRTIGTMVTNMNKHVEPDELKRRNGITWVPQNPVVLRFAPLVIDFNHHTTLTLTLTQIGILNRRMIVSRKRTRNLFDMTSLWKKTVLAAMDSNISDPLSAESDDMDEDMKSDLSDSEGRSMAFGFNIRHGLIH
jgi:hypothetical protein